MRKNPSPFTQGIIIGVLVTLLVVLSYNLVEDRFIYGSGKADSFLTKDVEKKLKTMDKLVQDNYLNEVDKEKVEDGMFRGLASGLEDHYSVYYTKEEYQEITQETEGRYKGIGVVMQQNQETKDVFVAKCYKGSPAEKVGIKPSDIIKGVNGQEVEGLPLNEVGDLVRDSKKEEVDLTIYREGEGKELSFTITKEKLEVELVNSKMLEDHIGYISIAEFSEVTKNQILTTYKELKGVGLEKLVIDLRNNPGGLVSSVTEICDLFLKKDDMIVYTEDKMGNRLEYRAQNDDKIQIPLVVLVNEYSASASEIFAGVVKDYELGTIVGNTTFGKGVVQKIFTLGDESALKLTISNYFTPKGNNIHKKGIEPDVKVPMDIKYISYGEEISQDLQLKKAIEILKK